MENITTTTTYQLRKKEYGVIQDQHILLGEVVKLRHDVPYRPNTRTLGQDMGQDVECCASFQEVMDKPFHHLRSMLLFITHLCFPL